MHDADAGAYNLFERAAVRNRIKPFRVFLISPRDSPTLTHVPRISLTVPLSSRAQLRSRMMRAISTTSSSDKLPLCRMFFSCGGSATPGCQTGRFVLVCCTACRSLQLTARSAVSVQLCTRSQTWRPQKGTELPRWLASCCR